jgi:ATP-dependent Clp protease ATP-binding subunit ClpA
MFERFTHAAREAVVRAQHEARELDQSPIGTEHVLLALLAEESGPIATALHDSGVDAAYVRSEIIRRVGPGPAAEPGVIAESDAEDAAALKAIGIDLAAVRRAIEENFGPGSLRLPRSTTPPRKGLLGRFYGGSSHIPFSDRAKKLLELSLREAIRLKHNFIAPEHIMLGMLREGHGLAAQILSEAHVDFDKLRADLTRSLGERAA